jgi:adenylate cyclase
MWPLMPAKPGTRCWAGWYPSDWLRLGLNSAKVKSSQRFDAAAALSLLVLALLFSLTPLYERLDALSVDTLLYARHMLFGQRHGAETSPTVVVGLDEITYASEPFANVPNVMWTPQIARVQDAILAAGAKVVGYDLILSTSMESFLPGYEKPFLLSLMKAARQGRVVLGKVQHSHKSVAPHPSQSFVVKNERNVRSLNMLVDVDDIIRRIPLFFETQSGGREPSMSLELAGRALGKQAERVDAGVLLGDYRIPGSESNAAYVNFQGGGDVPTYSFADLFACAEAGDSAYFQRHFKDKVVLLGAVLDVEDRKLTAKRLMTGRGAGVAVEPCGTAGQAPPSAFRRDTIPGVYILASAANDLIRGDSLDKLSREGAMWVIALVVLLVAMLSIHLQPLWSALVILGLMLVDGLAGLMAIQSGLLIPVLPLLMLIGVGYSLMLLYRYMVMDQQRLRIRNLFSLYLEPSVVDRMVEAERLPELGGELREVTIWFSDLANFTRLSEGLEAHDLVSLMNRYFTLVTDIIESHGGFVDKYIGDAVVAVFGAPHDDPYHAGHAVAAALTVRERLEQMNRAGEFGGRQIATRTGINTGQAVVGNVGSAKRFNYTVMGDAVNLAARLEGANKAMETRILISDAAARRLPKSIVLREVATIRVKGKQQSTRVFEPLTMASWRPIRRKVGMSKGKLAKLAHEFSIPVDQGALEAANQLSLDFAKANELYRERRFDKMIELLQPHADDPAAVVLLKRAREMLANPPPEDWDGVDVLTEK